MVFQGSQPRIVTTTSGFFQCETTCTRASHKVSRTLHCTQDHVASRWQDLENIKGKGTVALYTLVGEDKYRVILTTADVQKSFEYPLKAAELNRKILAFRDVLQNPKLDPLPLAQELYQILVAPIAKDLKAAKARLKFLLAGGSLTRHEFAQFGQ